MARADDESGRKSVGRKPISLGDGLRVELQGQRDAGVSQATLSSLHVHPCHNEPRSTRAPKIMERRASVLAVCVEGSDARLHGCWVPDAPGEVGGTKQPALRIWEQKGVFVRSGYTQCKEVHGEHLGEGLRDRERPGARWRPVRWWK